MCTDPNEILIFEAQAISGLQLSDKVYSIRKLELSFPNDFMKHLPFFFYASHSFADMDFWLSVAYPHMEIDVKWNKSLKKNKLTFYPIYVKQWNPIYFHMY